MASWLGLTPLSSLPHLSRHSRTFPVTPAPFPSLPLRSQHSRTFPGILVLFPAFQFFSRHSSSFPVIPAKAGIFLSFVANLQQDSGLPLRAELALLRVQLGLRASGDLLERHALYGVLVHRQPRPVRGGQKEELRWAAVGYRGATERSKCETLHQYGVSPPVRDHMIVIFFYKAHAGVSLHRRSCLKSQNFISWRIICLHS